MEHKSSKVESLGVKCFEDIYRGKKVFITGHTGFKGAWLSLWLTELGADIVGYSLPLDVKSEHYKNLHLPVDNHYNNIDHFESLFAAIQNAKPDIVFHLAAQSLVRESYFNPIHTFQTNIIGTLHVYLACLNVSSVKALISITTDKVYQNNEWHWGYREIDRLGGNDPYSASKACVEIMSESFRRSFLNGGSYLLATARAGNVIGGGDWAEDRLIPDFMRAYQSKQTLKIRNPQAIRPWQHVLEPITGYLILGQKLLQGNSKFATTWNFGPEYDDAISVIDLLKIAKKFLADVPIEHEPSPLQEAQILKLDCSKAKSELQWKPIWNVEEAIRQTVLWYKEFFDEKKIISKQQLYEYICDAMNKKAAWIN